MNKTTFRVIACVSAALVIAATYLNLFVAPNPAGNVVTLCMVASYSLMMAVDMWRDA